MGREAWRGAVRGVTESRTRLSDWTTATVFHRGCIYIFSTYSPIDRCVARLCLLAPVNDGAVTVK